MGPHGRWPHPLAHGDLLGRVAVGDLAEDRELAFGERQRLRRETPLAWHRKPPARGDAEREREQLTQTHAVRARQGLARPG